MVPSGELSTTEREALHELQLGIEHLHRSYGALLTWHHRVGHAMDHFELARSLLEESGHGPHAEALRDDVLPAGTVGDNWSYEVVEAFREGFLSEVNAVEGHIRADLADGQTHVTERRLQSAWRRRASEGTGERN
jgi:hypothetical protein